MLLKNLPAPLAAHEQALTTLVETVYWEQTASYTEGTLATEIDHAISFVTSLIWDAGLTGELRYYY